MNPNSTSIFLLPAFFSTFRVVLLLTLVTFLTSNRSFAQTNTHVLVTGVVVDKDNNEPLPGATVLIKGTSVGTVSDEKGEFIIKTKLSFPFVVEFRSVGYKPVEVQVLGEGNKLSVALPSQAVLANEVVVTASRIEEDILASPVAIDKLSVRAIQQSPAASFYDALENLKGVQMLTSSLTFKVPNTRGFNIPNNFRFVQLVDGVDVQAATLGMPLGNAIGPTELDILSVEVVPGAASALYGMNAINGLASLSTKSPFQHQGLSLYQKTGLNHIDGTAHAPALLTETALRYAKVLNDRWAFKVNASYLRGIDWISNSQNDQNPQNANSANPRFAGLSGPSNPAADAWNKYGDERNNNVPVTVNYGGKTETFNVRRTGYWEKDIVPQSVQNLKFDGGLYYRLNDRTELSYTYRFGQVDGIFQRGNKIRLEDVTVQNHKLELKTGTFLFRTYTSIENTGNSYNLKPLADNLDLTHASNPVWGATFQSTLQNSLNQGVDLAQAMQLARSAADAGRAQPGTSESNELKNTITGINNWDHAANIAGAPATGGALLTQQSRTYHTDFQWDLSDRIKFANLLIGGDSRIYEVVPDGNNFVDFSKPLDQRTTPGGNNIYYTKYGVFAQLTKQLFQDKLKLTGSLRVDHNLEFSPKLNPRVAAVYNVAPKQYIRASYQNGYRFPSLFEALSFVNNGNVRRVGGLARVNEGLGYLENSYTLNSIDAFNSAVNAAVAKGAARTEAALNNRQLLQVANLPQARPEHINSYELGYKSVLLENRLSLDVDLYSNVYRDFLGQAEVAVPTSGKVGTEASVLDMLSRSRQTRYRVFTNARNVYNSYGAAVSLSYNVFGKFILSTNSSYNNIRANAGDDVFVTGFNTPRLTANASISNREVVRNVGFNVVWRWQESFLWQSPLANGVVPAYHTVDAQVTYRVPQLKSTVKAGATNLLNNRYIQYAAGPTIGGMYYLAVTVDGLFK